MISHLEDKDKTNAYREDGFMWRYATRCGVFFIGGGSEHRIAAPGEAPTCPTCKAIADERKVGP